MASGETFLSKYGVARHIYVTVTKRSAVDFAVGADWTPAGGDVKISKDGGAAANTTNLPVAIVMGNTAIWDFSITATEMSAAQVVVTVADSATKAVEDQFFCIETYGNASAEHVMDFAQALPSNFSLLSITAAGLVAITSNVKKNTALSAFTFTMTDSTLHVPATGLTVTPTRSLDGAAFGACANAVSEVSAGNYKINLAAADLNANVVMLRFAATAADDLNILVITQP